MASSTRALKPLKEFRIPPEELDRSINAAIRVGTFARHVQHFCEGCRQMVDSIYYVVPGSHDELCPECANKAGHGPKQDAERLNGKDARRRTVPA
ncbi:MAG: hypothetical protein H7Z14_14175 [Anaerolineae bacterium]|nr:hypothetical protein [Phycisphaerae bacterium]